VEQVRGWRRRYNYRSGRCRSYRFSLRLDGHRAPNRRFNSHCRRRYDLFGNDRGENSRCRLARKDRSFCRGYRLAWCRFGHGLMANELGTDSGKGAVEDALDGLGLVDDLAETVFGGLGSAFQRGA